ncbi:hypothetical protein OG828_19695 [Streptomyces sp. NBC_00457]|uniref:hypothetical protein n=1 Tax=Streptomyces sp. NBC_00457 TaxID=2975748 RepID=UPI002E1F8EB9
MHLPSWADRDIVLAQDVSGDGVTDTVYRRATSGRLILRKGIAADSGGVDLNSLSTAADSSGGTDTEYSASGWAVASVPFLLGTPDANNDNIPDIWAVRSDGSVRFHPGGRATTSSTGTAVVGPTTWWQTRIAVG